LPQLLADDELGVAQLQGVLDALGQGRAGGQPLLGRSPIRPAETTGRADPYG
jgi:hypothetical protein